jgi:hypothetical protein
VWIPPLIHLDLQTQTKADSAIGRVIIALVPVARETSVVSPVTELV